MSYLEFHLLFNLPALLLLGWLARKKFTRTHARWIAVVLAIVVVFTSVWDNIGVARNIWNFPDSRIVMRIGWIPLEEYLFFILAAIEACLLTVLFLPPPRAAAP